jgi:hypothetical protein
MKNFSVKLTWPNLRLESSGWVFEPTGLKDGVFAARVLFADKFLQSTVCLLNMTDNPHQILQGTLLGRAEAVDVYCFPKEAQIQ